MKYGELIVFLYYLKKNQQKLAPGPRKECAQSLKRKLRSASAQIWDFGHIGYRTLKSLTHLYFDSTWIR